MAGGLACTPVDRMGTVRHLRRREGWEHEGAREEAKGGSWAEGGGRVVVYARRQDVQDQDKQYAFVNIHRSKKMDEVNAPLPSVNYGGGLQANTPRNINAHFSCIRCVSSMKCNHSRCLGCCRLRGGSDSTRHILPSSSR